MTKKEEKCLNDADLISARPTSLTQR